MTRTSDAMNRGILLEAGGGSGYALTPDGRFVKVACSPDAEEGQEISLGDRRRWVLPANLGARLVHRPAWAMALAACLVVAVLMPFAVGRALASGDPIAFVTFDVNPSLEFGVNRWERVVSAAGINADGAEILAEIDWRGRPVDDVLVAAAQASEALGYLAAENGQDVAVVVAAVPVGLGKGLPADLEQRVERAREQVGELVGAAAPGATVQSVLGDSSSLRDEAQALGLSVGAYSVLLVAQEAGLDLDLDDLEGGLGRAIVSAGGHPGEVLQEAHQYRGLSRLAEKFQDRNGLGDRGGDDDDADGDGADGDDGVDDDDESDDDHPGNGSGANGNGAPGSGGHPGSGRDGGRGGEQDRDDRGSGSDQGQSGAGSGDDADDDADDQGDDQDDDSDDDEGLGDSGANDDGQSTGD